MSLPTSDALLQTSTGDVPSHAPHDEESESGNETIRTIHQTTGGVHSDTAPPLPPPLHRINDSSRELSNPPAHIAEESLKQRSHPSPQRHHSLQTHSADYINVDDDDDDGNGNGTVGPLHTSPHHRVDAPDHPTHNEKRPDGTVVNEAETDVNGEEEDDDYDDDDVVFENVPGMDENDYLMLTEALRELANPLLSSGPAMAAAAAAAVITLSPKVGFASRAHTGADGTRGAPCAIEDEEAKAETSRSHPLQVTTPAAAATLHHLLGYDYRETAADRAERRRAQKRRPRPSPQKDEEGREMMKPSDKGEGVTVLAAAASAAAHSLACAARTVHAVPPHGVHSDPSFPATAPELRLPARTDECEGGEVAPRDVSVTAVEASSAITLLEPSPLPPSEGEGNGSSGAAALVISNGLAETIEYDTQRVAPLTAPPPPPPPPLTAVPQQRKQPPSDHVPVSSAPSTSSQPQMMPHSVPPITVNDTVATPSHTAQAARGGEAGAVRSTGTPAVASSATTAEEEHKSGTPETTHQSACVSPLSGLLRATDMTAIPQQRQHQQPITAGTQNRADEESATSVAVNAAGTALRHGAAEVSSAASTAPSPLSLTGGTPQPPAQHTRTANEEEEGVAVAVKEVQQESRRELHESAGTGLRRKLTLTRGGDHAAVDASSAVTVRTNAVTVDAEAEASPSSPGGPRTMLRLAKRTPVTQQQQQSLPPPPSSSAIRDASPHSTTSQVVLSPFSPRVDASTTTAGGGAAGFTPTTAMEASSSISVFSPRPPGPTHGFPVESAPMTVAHTHTTVTDAQGSGNDAQQTARLLSPPREQQNNESPQRGGAVVAHAVGFAAGGAGSHAAQEDAVARCLLPLPATGTGSHQLPTANEEMGVFHQSWTKSTPHLHGTDDAVLCLPAKREREKEEEEGPDGAGTSTRADMRPPPPLPTPVAVSSSATAVTMSAHLAASTSKPTSSLQAPQPQPHPQRPNRPPSLARTNAASDTTDRVGDPVNMAVSTATVTAAPTSTQTVAVVAVAPSVTADAASFSKAMHSPRPQAQTAVSSPLSSYTPTPYAHPHGASGGATGLTTPSPASRVHGKTGIPLPPAPTRVDFGEVRHTVEARYRLCKKISEGTYGEVYIGEDRQTGEAVALKRLKALRGLDGFPITSLREVIALRHIERQRQRLRDEEGHSGEGSAEAAGRVSASTKKEPAVDPLPELVRLSDVLLSGDDTHDIFLVFPYSSSSVAGLFSRRFPFTLPEVAYIFRQLVSGVAKLHRMGIIHRDIKSDNVLITAEGQVQLTDFGLCAFAGSGRRALTPSMINLSYRPPEMLLGSVEYDEKVDVWSVGCFLAQVFLTAPPFSRPRTAEEQTNVARHNRSAETELEQLALIADVLGPLSLVPADAFPASTCKHLAHLQQLRERYQHNGGTGSSLTSGRYGAPTAATASSSPPSSSSASSSSVTNLARLASLFEPSFLFSQYHGFREWFIATLENRHARLAAAARAGRPVPAVPLPSPACLDVLVAVFQLDPRRRPTAAQLLQMPFFQLQDVKDGVASGGGQGGLAAREERVRLSLREKLRQYQDSHSAPK